MKLKFLGRESGFGDNHTSAYFTTLDNEIVIIDCPVSTFQKLKKSKSINLKDFNRINILITHTHGDHIGGLGLFIQYAYFVLKVPVEVIAPSEAVKEDIHTVLKIEGVESSWYKLYFADFIKSSKDWLIRSIETTHSPQLKDKCFGYQLNIDGENIVYTGDTSTLAPFIKYLYRAELYVDASVHYGGIHLKLSELLNVDNRITILNSNPKAVYLMHLDDVDAAKSLIQNHKLFKIVEIVED